MKGAITIDCGNTRIKAAYFVGNDLHATTSFGYDELAVLERFISSHKPLHAIVSSVTEAALTRHVMELVNARVAHACELRRDMALPISVRYNLAHIGLDRVAAAVGASALCRGARLLVVDAGTALTLDVVDYDGSFDGGYICAGIGLSLSSLHEHTSRLPQVAPGAAPVKGLPQDTEQAMLWGAVLGGAAQVDYLAKRHGCDMVALTGGDAQLLAKHVSHKHFVEPHLVAHGLNTILQYHINNANQ